MNERDLEALAPELQRMLDAEQKRPPLARAALDRIGTRVAASCLAIPAAPASPAPPSGAASSGGWAHRWLAGRAGSIGVGFIAGAVAGGGVVGALRPRPSPAPVIQVAPEPARPSPPVVPSPASAPPLPVEPAPSVVLPPQAKSPRRAGPHPTLDPTREPPAASDPDHALAAERSLLEIAQAALARGNVAGALDAIERHERGFPNGRLAEEREALRVQTLVRAGRAADARDAAGRFRGRFANGLLRPVVEAAIKQIP